MNLAYIDGQNLVFGTAHATEPWSVDFKRLRVYLRDKYHVGEAYYYIGAYDARHQGLYNNLQRDGYIVVFREHIESSVSKKGLSSLYRRRTPDIYRDYLDSESIKKKIMFQGK